MKDDRVLCPRCEQGELMWVEIHTLGKRAVVCSECEALWWSPEHVGTPKWVQFEEMMKGEGVSDPTWLANLRVIDYMRAR